MPFDFVGHDSKTPAADAVDGLFEAVRNGDDLNELPRLRLAMQNLLFLAAGVSLLEVQSRTSSVIADALRRYGCDESDIAAVTDGINGAVRFIRRHPGIVRRAPTPEELEEKRDVAREQLMLELAKAFGPCGNA